MRILWFFLALLSPFVLASPLSLIDVARGWVGSPVLLRQWQHSLIGADAECFPERRWQGVDLKPISRRDCLEAAKTIVRGGKTGAPMHFSRDPGVGMQLPATWASGSCAIRIDAKNPRDEDTFPIFVVSNAAFHIAQQCTKPDTPGLGGIGYIGPQKVIMVFVYGQQAQSPVPTGIDTA